VLITKTMHHPKALVFKESMAYNVGIICKPGEKAHEPKTQVLVQIA
jgi:hypothetical protein